MRSIFVRVEPTVRLVIDAKPVELLMMLPLSFEARPEHAGALASCLHGSAARSCVLIQMDSQTIFRYRGSIHPFP